MAAHVLHLGVDDCHRVAVLRSVGYRVDECGSLLQLAKALERANGADAVFLTESDGISPEQAISLARERSAAPVILFCRSTYGANEDEFDLVIPPLTSPEKWLQDVGSLVEWSRMVRVQAQAITEQSRSLRMETSLVRRYSERERERSLRERARNSNANASDPWKSTGSH